MRNDYERFSFGLFAIAGCVFLMYYAWKNRGAK